MTDSDARDMNFVLRPIETTMELSGHVSTNSAQHLSTLKLVLYRYGNVESAVQTIDLQTSSMFFLQNVPIDGAVCLSGNYANFQGLLCELSNRCIL